MASKVLRLITVGFLSVELWESLPYADILDQLKSNIHEVIFDILLEICRKVIENYFERIDACMKFLGIVLNDLLFQRYNLIVSITFFEIEIRPISLVQIRRQVSTSWATGAGRSIFYSTLLKNCKYYMLCKLNVWFCHNAGFPFWTIWKLMTPYTDTAHWEYQLVTYNISRFLIDAV